MALVCVPPLPPPPPGPPVPGGPDRIRHVQLVLNSQSPLGGWAGRNIYYVPLGPLGKWGGWTQFPPNLLEFEFEVGPRRLTRPSSVRSLRWKHPPFNSKSDFINKCMQRRAPPPKFAYSVSILNPPQASGVLVCVTRLPPNNTGWGAARRHTWRVRRRTCPAACACRPSTPTTAGPEPPLPLRGGGGGSRQGPDPLDYFNPMPYWNGGLRFTVRTLGIIRGGGLVGWWPS